MNTQCEMSDIKLFYKFKKAQLHSFKMTLCATNFLPAILQFDE